MNDVRVLTGDARHFAGFLVSPEAALSEHTKLIVPESAAVHELRLVPPAYQRVNNWSTGPYSEATAPVELLPKVPLENMFLFCNERDREDLTRLLGGHNCMPKGIVTYPNAKLRTESWRDPVGDHQVAGDLLKKTFVDANLTPSIQWSQDLFPHAPKIEDETFVRGSDIRKSREIVKTAEGLRIVEQGAYDQELAAAIKKKIADTQKRAA